MDSYSGWDGGPWSWWCGAYLNWSLVCLLLPGRTCLLHAKSSARLQKPMARLYDLQLCGGPTPHQERITAISPKWPASEAVHLGDGPQVQDAFACLSRHHVQHPGQHRA